jgi:serine protease Do
LTKNAKDKKTAVLMAVFFSAFLLSFDCIPAQGLEALDREISRIVDQISGAVVTVEARPQETQAPLFPGQKHSLSEPINAVVGSGLLIDSLGHILTSLGLVEGYGDFSVKIAGQSYSVKLIGVDRRHQLAILKVDSIFQSYIQPSPFPPLAGRMVLAYGNALGHTGYPTLGIVAGRQSDGSFLVSGSVLPGLLGGGVFDLSGKLIGIISSGSVRVNDYRKTWGGIMILPASIAYMAADRIICCGNRDAGYLGVRSTAIELVSSDEKIVGEAVVISELEPSSPAIAAGLRIGDIITRIDSRKVTSDRDLQQLIGSAGPDSTITIEYMRGQRHLSINVALTSLSQRSIYAGYPGLSPQQNRQTLIAIELQKRIDSMHSEMQRLQKQLESLLGRAGSAR